MILGLIHYRRIAEEWQGESEVNNLWRPYKPISSILQGPPTTGSAIPCHDPQSRLALELRARLHGVFQTLESPPSHLQPIWWLNNWCYFNLPVEIFVAFHSLFQLNSVPVPPLSPTISNLAANWLREVQDQSSPSGISISSLAPSWPRPDCLSLRTVFNSKRENKNWTALHFQMSILNIKL